MTDAEIARLQRDLEDIILRMRAVEGLQSPVLAGLREDLRDMQRRVAEMDTHGTAVTVERFRTQDVHIAGIREDIQEMKEAQKSTRNIVKSALITAGLAIGVNIIVAVVTWAVANT